MNPRIAPMFTPKVDFSAWHCEGAVPLSDSELEIWINAVYQLRKQVAYAIVSTVLKK